MGIPLCALSGVHESHGPRVVWINWYSLAGRKINLNYRALGHRARLSSVGTIVVVRYNQWNYDSEFKEEEY